VSDTSGRQTRADRSGTASHGHASGHRTNQSFVGTVTPPTKPQPQEIHWHPQCRPTHGEPRPRIPRDRSYSRRLILPATGDRVAGPAGKIIYSQQVSGAGISNALRSADVARYIPIRCTMSMTPRCPNTSSACP
jgi:hypothetical protein